MNLNFELSIQLVQTMPAGFDVVLVIALLILHSIHQANRVEKSPLNRNYYQNFITRGAENSKSQHCVFRQNVGSNFDKSSMVFE